MVLLILHLFLLQGVVLLLLNIEVDRFIRCLHLDSQARVVNVGISGARFKQRGRHTLTNVLAQLSSELQLLGARHSLMR